MLFLDASAKFGKLGLQRKQLLIFAEQIASHVDQQFPQSDEFFALLNCLQRVAEFLEALHCTRYVFDGLRWHIARSILAKALVENDYMLQLSAIRMAGRREGRAARTPQAPKFILFF
ncbi:hypothetical protein P6F26_10795 [Roseibacterium sp. SDUM158017]|uniref:hypothetical protein n=1 Tax=Roseicyclus salinarum TaxID=3036773 RepID=UPI0024154DDC|nr:hypothetical protein [Roseibacterium sp. SDUM158017]MDG4648932.1 hypothetical protein [Roseibacterium sp. SDUM158017]